MALNKTLLKTQIKQALEDQRVKEDNPSAALDDLATKLSNAIDSFVKSGTVSTSVNTTVTGSSPAGPVTGTGTGSGTGTIQ